MPTHADLLVLLGPLADIMPRMFGLVASCVFVVLAVEPLGRAIRRRRSAAFLAAWALGIVASSAAFLCFASLADYGRAAARRTYLSVEPLSAVGLAEFMKVFGLDVMLSMAVGAVIWSVLIVRRPAGDVSAEDVLTGHVPHPERASMHSFRHRK